MVQSATKKCMASGRRVIWKFWRFQMAVSQWKLAWLTPNLGILWISVRFFWLCESIVANPIIYRLLPRPSWFETRQLSKQNTESSLASLSWNSSQAPTEWSAIFAFGVFCTLKKVLRQPHNVLTLQVSLSLRALGGFSFHRSYKHTIYCATQLVSLRLFLCISRCSESDSVSNRDF